jgi:hypothetical protein
MLVALVLLPVGLIACTPPDQIPRSAVLPRALGGFHLLDPAPADAAAMPNGTLHWSDGQAYGVEIFAAEGRIFTISIEKKLESAEEVAEIRAAAERTYGADHTDAGGVWTWVDGATRATLLVTRGEYRITLSDIAAMQAALGDETQTQSAGQ